MKSIEIEGSVRSDLGSKYAARLRKEGQVPCVIYGTGENTHFSTPKGSFQTLAYTPDAYTVQVKVDDKVVSCIMQDIQFHPVTDDIVHVDFIELMEGKMAQMEIPVRLSGSSRGVRNGGKLKQNLRKLIVKALPKNLPDAIEIDINELRIGESIRVEDVVAAGDYEIVNAANSVIVGVSTSRKAVNEEEEDGTEGAEAGEEGASEGSEDSSES